MNKILNYPTKHREGFNDDDITKLLKEYPNIDMVKFNDCLFGDTCLLKGNEVIRYKHDIERAVRVATGGKERIGEWD